MARYHMIWSFYVFRSLSLGCFFSPLLCAVGPLVFSKKEQVSILVTELNVSMLLPKKYVFEMLHYHLFIVDQKAL